MKKKILAVFFVIFMYSAVSYAANYEITSSTPISAGLTRNEYRITGDGTHYANVLVCDLTNPYIELSVIAGQGEYNQKATVSQMAERTGASAVTNGDFFNMRLEGTPNGPSIIDGEIQSSPCFLQDVYSLGIDETNTAQITQIGFYGELQTPSGRVYPIDGVNKTYYWYEPDLQYSHENKLQVYTDFWAASTRGDANNSEILVNSEGIVEQISEGKRFNFQVPDGKYIIQASGTAMDFVHSYVRIGERVNITYDLTPDVNWKFLIGGHALLVDGGQTVPYTKDLSALEGNRARTAAGVSADGKTLYIASVEGRTWRSNGMRLAQLSNFMQAIGSYRAVNLDGGGSTAMVVNENGEYRRVVNPENNGSERRVVNGIGVFSTAVPGELVGFNIEGPDQIILGDTQYFGLGNGWDGNGNPASAEGYGYSFELDNDCGIFEGNYFTALKPGTVNVTITRTDGKTSTKTVQILDASHIQEVALDTSSRRVGPGETVDYILKGKLLDGRIINLNSRPGILQLYGFEGEINKEYSQAYISDLGGMRKGDIGVTFGDKVTSQSLYDRNTNVVEMHIGSADYRINEEDRTMDTALFTSNGRTMVPVRFIVEALGGEVGWHEETGTVLIGYKGKNIQVPLDSPTIYADGEEVAIDSPAVLKDDRTFVPIRFIAEALEMNIGYRPFDERVTIVEDSPASDDDRIINMNIGSREYKVNKENRIMDTELFTENGRTMVPLRFLIEGLGGSVDWNDEEMKAVMEYAGNHIEIPIGSENIIVNGAEQPVDSPAMLKDERTFVPVRFVAEALGMKVSYRPLDERVSISEFSN